MTRPYFVYVLASRSRNLYVGVTNSLARRVREHNEGLIPGFTTRYRIHRLVYYEVLGDPRATIAREKQIKGWRRRKKVALIEDSNPTWEDLSAAWPRVAEGEKQIPRSARDDHSPVGTTSKQLAHNDPRRASTQSRREGLRG